MSNSSILIIDSGSTKSDWVLLDGAEKMEMNSVGMNPNFTKEDAITAAIKNTIGENVKPESINEIHFFGAGCSGNEQKQIVKNAFGKIFTQAKIFVDIDAMGSVIATCGDKPGISCILGTGCNSVFFDGEKILPNNYGLGYILSDEGAGTWLGRKLITHYLYGLLPTNLSDSFRKEYNLTKDDVINQTYNTNNANAWLASFSKFLSSHRENSWVKNTISEGFDEFMHLFVMNYNDYQQFPVHFVGSIAYSYKDILHEVATANKISLGKIIQKPIDGLVDFFK